MSITPTRSPEVQAQIDAMVARMTQPPTVAASIAGASQSTHESMYPDLHAPVMPTLTIDIDAESVESPKYVATPKATLASMTDSPKGALSTKSVTAEGTVVETKKEVSVLTKAINYAKKNPVKAALAITGIVALALVVAFAVTHALPVLIALGAVVAAGLLTCVALHMSRKVETLPPKPREPVGIPIAPVRAESVKEAGAKDVKAALKTLEKQSLDKLGEQTDRAISCVLALENAKVSACAKPSTKANKQLADAKSMLKAQNTELQKHFAFVVATKGIRIAEKRVELSISNKLGESGVLGSRDGISFSSDPAHNGLTINVRGLIFDGANAKSLKDVATFSRELNTEAIGNGIMAAPLGDLVVGHITEQFSRDLRTSSVSQALKSLEKNAKNANLDESDVDGVKTRLTAMFEEKKAFTLLVDKAVQELSAMKFSSDSLTVEQKLDEVHVALALLTEKLVAAGPLAGNRGSFVKSVGDKIGKIEVAKAAKEAQIAAEILDKKVEVANSNIKDLVGQRNEKLKEMNNMLIRMNSTLKVRSLTAELNTEGRFRVSTSIQEGLAAVSGEASKVVGKAEREIEALQKSITEIQAEISILNKRIATLADELLGLGENAPKTLPHKELMASIVKLNASIAALKSNAPEADELVFAEEAPQPAIQVGQLYTQQQMSAAFLTVAMMAAAAPSSPAHGPRAFGGLAASAVGGDVAINMPSSPGSQSLNARAPVSVIAQLAAGYHEEVAAEVHSPAAVDPMMASTAEGPGSSASVSSLVNFDSVD
jgi:hypothetical protein